MKLFKTKLLKFFSIFVISFLLMLFSTLKVKASVITLEIGEEYIISNAKNCQTTDDNVLIFSNNNTCYIVGNKSSDNVVTISYNDGNKDVKQNFIIKKMSNLNNQYVTLNELANIINNGSYTDTVKNDLKQYLNGDIKIWAGELNNYLYLYVQSGNTLETIQFNYDQEKKVIGNKWDFSWSNHTNNYNDNYGNFKEKYKIYVRSMLIWVIESCHNFQEFLSDYPDLEKAYTDLAEYFTFTLNDSKSPDTQQYTFIVNITGEISLSKNIYKEPILIEVEDTEEPSEPDIPVEPEKDKNDENNVDSTIENPSTNTPFNIIIISLLIGSIVVLVIVLKKLKKNNFMD